MLRCWEIDNTGKSIPKAQQTMGGPVLDVCWDDMGTKVFMASCDKQVCVCIVVCNIDQLFATTGEMLGPWEQPGSPDCRAPGSGQSMSLGQGTQLFGPHDRLLGQDDEVLGHESTHSNAQYRPARACLLRGCGVPHGCGGDCWQGHRDLPVGRAAQGVQKGGEPTQVSASLCVHFQRQEERSNRFCVGER